MSDNNLHQFQFLLPLWCVKIQKGIFFAYKVNKHIFEIKNDCLFKDGKEIKLINSIKIYRYKNFLYMESSHSMFIVKNTDFILGDREAFLNWASSCHISIKRGY